MGASKHIDRHQGLWSYYWTATFDQVQHSPPGLNLVCDSTTASLPSTLTLTDTLVERFAKRAIVIV